MASTVLDANEGGVVKIINRTMIQPRGSPYLIQESRLKESGLEEHVHIHICMYNGVWALIP